MQKVTEKLKEIKEQIPSGEYCIAQHVYVWMQDVVWQKETYFGKPCETCRYVSSCTYDHLTSWIDNVSPVLYREGIKISVGMDHAETPIKNEIEEDIEDAKNMRKGKFRPTGEYCMSRFFVRWYYALIKKEVLRFEPVCAYCPYWSYCSKHNVTFRDHIFPLIERVLDEETEKEKAPSK